MSDSHMTWEPPLRLIVEMVTLLNPKTGETRQVPGIAVEEWCGETASGRDKWKKRGILTAIKDVENPTFGDLLAAVGRVVDGKPEREGIK